MTTEPITIQTDTLAALTAALNYPFPAQGHWSADDYLLLARHTNHLAELSDGAVEVLPMPGEHHQDVLLFLYRCLYAFVTSRNLGKILVAPLMVRLWEGKFREPDLVCMLTEHAHRRHSEYWETPDLVAEVVSPGNPDHDLVTKRHEYAQAGIPEYWIVDPRNETITILHLEQGHYVVHGQFGRGTVACSVLLAGLEVDVGAVFDVS